MTDGKKIIVFIIIGLMLFGSGLLTGYYISQARDSKLIAEYQETITGLGCQITELQNTNSELADSNSRLEKTASELRRQLDAIELRIGEAEGIISEIESGISGASDDIQRIIRAVGSVIEKIITLGKTE